MAGQVVEARRAMGTRWEIVLPGEDQVQLLAAAEEALDEVERLEAQLSVYRESSEVFGINTFAARQAVRVEPRLFRLLELALEVSHATDNAFDPTVGPLLRCWGFTGGQFHQPDAEALAAARALTGAHLVGLDEEEMSVWFGKEGVSLDLGAIGKGYGIDRAVEALEETGIHRALLHAGTSTVFGLGTGADGQPWRIALRDPRTEAENLLGEVSLADRALSVSGPHNKAFRAGDRLYGHVLDPRTGEPTQAALLAAVSHPSATLTDALSTALLVLGQSGPALLEARFPDADYLVLTGDCQPGVIFSGGPNHWNLKQNSV